MNPKQPIRLSEARFAYQLVYLLLPEELLQHSASSKDANSYVERKKKKLEVNSKLKGNNVVTTHYSAIFERVAECWWILHTLRVQNA